MRIVILDSNTLGDDLDLCIFDKLGDVTIYGYTNENEVITRIKDFDVVITNKVILFEEQLINTSVRLICVTATGVNNVDIAYCKKVGIVVSNVSGYSTESVAQHTFSMLFYLYEKLAYYDQYVKSGNYINDEMFTHFDRKFNEIKGKTWGIVGLGNIGKRVAEIASAFGSNIIYYSTSGRNNNNEYQQVNFEELLSKSDIISIHAPLNTNTKDLFSYDEFKKMKKSAILLNLGRGPIVNEDGLAMALENDLIAGVGLDVLVHEPMKENCKLLSFDDSTKLLITPHIAWASVEARNTMLQEVYLNVLSFFDGFPRNNVCE